MKKIKTLTVISYLKDIDEDIQYISSVTHFNQQQQETEVLNYTNDGELESKTITVYNEKNQKVKELYYFDSGELSEEHFFTWSTEGKLEKQQINYPDESVSVKKYLRSGNILEITTTDEFDETEEKELIEINEQGDTLSKTVYDEDDEIKDQIINEFNDNNRLIKQTEYGANNMFILARHYQYYDNNLLHKIILANDKNQITDTITYTYDNLDRIIHQEVSHRYSIVYEYNDAENSIIESHILANGVLDSKRITYFDADKRVIEEETLDVVKKYSYVFYSDDEL